MKNKKLLLIISSIAISLLLLCSCSRSTIRRTGDMSRDVVRRGANFIDSGLNAVENGVENGANTVIGGMYGANSGYNGNAAIGTNYVENGKATEISPTLRSKARTSVKKYKDKTNKGEINSNDGNADGGMGSNNNKDKGKNRK